MTYLGEKSSKGQPHGKGKYTFSENESYDGQWIHGQFHGYGVYTFATGNVYAGNFEKGKMTGHAEWKSKNGDTYVGEFLDGVRHGVGICNFARGDIYEGEWIQGERTGQGIMKYVTDVPGKFQIYEGEFDGGKMHGHGSYQFSNGNKYEGEWVENKMTGSGVWTSPQGDKYIGDYVDGERHGFGCYTFADGDSYEGEWVHGERTGQGVMKSVTDTPGVFSVYEGEFVQGKRHGFGLYKYANGNRYEGAWNENQMTGNGCWTSVDGDKYNGSFVDGEREGLGTYTFASGDVYEGEWLAGERTGRGMMKFAHPPATATAGDNNDDDTTGLTVTGGSTTSRRTPGSPGGTLSTSPDGGFYSKYEGEFVNGNMHGYGVYYFANGNRYEGAFVDGSMTGTGMWTATNGDKYLGVFKNGEREGLGTYSFASGERYEGQWLGGERNGHGLLIRTDGSKYVGDFASGKFEGKGALYSANGDVFHGMYVNNKRCGEGKMDYADGSYYEGEYSEDERHGQGTYFSSGDNKIHKGNWVMGVMTDGKTSAGMAPPPSVLSKLGKGAVLLNSRDIRESPVGVLFAGESKFAQIAGTNKTIRASQVKLLLPVEFQSHNAHAIKEYIAKEGKTFVDPDFVPLACSLFAPDDEKDDGGIQIVWRRPTQFMRGNYSVFDVIEPCDIKQGYLGDCWLLSALASLAEFPVLIEALFAEESKRASAEGLYELNLCVSGQWKAVLLDDFFPCRGPRGGPMYAGCNGNELWAMLAEKAYAKIHGGYSRIEGGMPEEALMDLTGDPTTSYFFNKPEVQEMVKNGSLWDKLVYADSVGYVLTASTHGKDTETEIQEIQEIQGDGSVHILKDVELSSGLVQGHAYSLIAIQELSNGAKLVLLRNPWGTKEWSGAYSDNSREWTPALRQEVADTKHDFNNQSDGLFWMQYSDLLSNFDRVSVCACRTPGYHPKPWKETRAKTFFSYSPELNEVYLSCILKIKPIADTMAVFTVHQANKRTVGAPNYIDIGLTILKVIDHGPEEKETYEHVGSVGCLVERENAVEVPMLYADCTYLVVAVTTGGCLRQQYNDKAGIISRASVDTGMGNVAPLTPTAIAANAAMPSTPSAAGRSAPPPPSPATPATPGMGPYGTPNPHAQTNATPGPALFDGEELSTVGEKVVDELFNRYDLLQEQGLNATSLDWVLQCMKPQWDETVRKRKIEKILSSFDTKMPEEPVDAIKEGKGTGNESHQQSQSQSQRLLTQYGFRAAMSCNHVDAINGFMRSNIKASSGVAHAAAKARQKALLTDLLALGYDEDLNLVGVRSVNISIHSEESIEHCFVSSDPDGLIYEAAMELPVVHTGSCEGMEYPDWRLYTKSNGFSGSSYCAMNLCKDTALEITYTVTGINVTSATGVLAGNLVIPPGQCEILQHVLPTRGSNSWNAGISFSTKQIKWSEEQHLNTTVCKQQARRLAAFKQNPSLAVFSRIKVPSKSSSTFVSVSKQKSSLQFLNKEYC